MDFLSFFILSWPTEVFSDEFFNQLGNACPFLDGPDAKGFTKFLGQVEGRGNGANVASVHQPIMSIAEIGARMAPIRGLAPFFLISKYNQASPNR